MNKNILFLTVVVSAIFSQKLISNPNQLVSKGNLREIVEMASRSDQKVFVEDFTGLD
ncbi:MAG: hypothetical protein HOD97_03245 [Candidatus Marinimicrobia bacterium]|jgi:hypothetical protein|nr:hypothetical protein [Candidatus Neomarinimicrobiota bacterium]MBT3618295.1 hypothetical protein [Candidatus Neomarinimicrobiota bacterium]MBT3828240.1 hypothetical protein [Candidatus Neomarinimicrobiota bacterium]MBT3997157.1 hypothetical protein [Candidatus Neomarinimicrobiota bacterium]MBT4280623.1 hypothetical protein [Candidatus Neomarinimicrobiota bacterium]